MSRFYRRVPKAFRDNCLYRKTIAKECATPSDRAAMKAACAEDVLFYLNTWAVTYDPRLPTPVIPFISYPYQDKAILTLVDCVRTQKDLVVEKSRDMGASWMCLYVMEWFYHFHPGTTFLFLSRKEGLVDRPGDPDTLFSKLDMIHRYLPEWMKPRQKRTMFAFANLDNESTMNGDSSTDAAGVGGRRTAVFLDEFSRMENAEAILQGTADVTGCRIFNFTPWGTANAAYRMASRPGVRKLRMHWSEHPVKAAGLYKARPGTGPPDLLDKGYKHAPGYEFVRDEKLRSPWYDAECARRANPREVAQMLDIDYAGSQYQFFDAAVVKKLQQDLARPAVWEGDVEYDPGTARPRRLVKRLGGPLRLWRHPTDAGDYRVPPAPYAAGADISQGQGATPSTFTVADAATGEKVAEYASPFVRPEKFAEVCVALCWWFLDADDMPANFAWERYGPGEVFGARVMALGYRRMYYRSSEDRLSKKATDIPGWLPTKDAKLTALSNYREALAARRFINPSAEALEECLGYVYMADGTVEHASWAQGTAGGSAPDPSGARENHGDRVIADALAFKMMVPLERKVEKPDEVRPDTIVTLAGRILAAENETRQSHDGWARY